MARLPELELQEINVLENYEYIEEGREKGINLLADLIPEIAARSKKEGREKK